MTTPTINETDSTNMPGVYELLLDEDMTIDSGDDNQEMAFHISHAGMAPVTRTIELYRPKITAGNTLGVESDGDLTKVNTLDGHTAQTGDTYAIANGSAGFVAIDTVVDAILVDTAEIGTAGAGLTNINLPDQTMNITGNLSGSVGSVTGAINTSAGTITTLDALDTAQDSQHSTTQGKVDTAQTDLDTLTDARGEPGQGAPGVSETPLTKLDYLYKAWRNRSTQSATTYSLYADDATTVDHKATVSDNGTTADKGEVATGP